MDSVGLIGYCAPMLTDPVDTNRIRRALVIKLRHHGDVLLAAPVFQALQNHIPGIETDALIYADSHPMLSLHPAVAQIHTIDRRWRDMALRPKMQAEIALWRSLRARRYDLLIQLTEHPRGAWLARSLRPRYSVARRYPGRRGRAWSTSFTHLYDVPAKPRHTVETHLDALRRMGIALGPLDRHLLLVPGADAERRVGELLAAHGLNHDAAFVLLHPTSRWMFKSWPENQTRALLERLLATGARVVLSCGPAPDERAANARLAAGLSGIVDLSGQLTLKELSALIARAQILVSVDSAPMHMAAAVGTPVVVLFGPSGEDEWGPWQVKARVLTSEHSCRPCHLAGCGDGRISDCLGAISVDRTFEAVSELLGAPRVARPACV